MPKIAKLVFVGVLLLFGGLVLFGDELVNSFYTTLYKFRHPQFEVLDSVTPNVVSQLEHPRNEGCMLDEVRNVSFCWSSWYDAGGKIYYYGFYNLRSSEVCGRSVLFAELFGSSTVYLKSHEKRYIAIRSPNLSKLRSEMVYMKGNCGLFASNSGTSMELVSPQ